MNPVQYMVLQCEQLSKADKELVVAKLANVRSVQDAFALVDAKEGWGYKVVDHHGNVGVITFRGVEAALLYRRNVVKVEPFPQDPLPEGIITDPLDAWKRVDLLGVSPKNIAQKVGGAYAEMKQRVQLFMQELKAKEEIIEAQEDALSTLRVTVAGYQAKEKRGEANADTTTKENIEPNSHGKDRPTQRPARHRSNKRSRRH